MSLARCCTKDGDTGEDYMKKIMITKKQYRILSDNWNDIQYALNDGFCMSIERVKPIRNWFRFIKYYKVYVEADYSTQKDVVNAFKRLGIF